MLTLARIVFYTVFVWYTLTLIQGVQLLNTATLVRVANALGR